MLQLKIVAFFDIAFKIGTSMYLMRMHDSSFRKREFSAFLGTKDLNSIDHLIVLSTQHHLLDFIKKVSSWSEAVKNERHDLGSLHNSFDVG